MMAPMIMSSVVASWFTGGSAPAPVIVQAPAKPAAKPAPVKPAPVAPKTPAGKRLLSNDSLNIQALAEPVEEQQTTADYDKF